VQIGTERRDGARLEALVDQRADRVVARRVHHVEHHAGADAARQVVERGAAADATSRAFRQKSRVSPSGLLVR
jgi:hypothetical protein